MDFDDVISRRKSVRSFSSKSVNWRDVLEAIDSAIQGPFAANQNNLKFLIVEDKKKIEKVSGLCEQEWMENCRFLVLACSDDANLESIFGERGRVYSRQQAGAAVNTLCLKLADLGLDSCWVGSYDDDEIREVFEIPLNYQVEAIVPIGYGSQNLKKKRKKSLENVIYWDGWDEERRKQGYEEGAEGFGRATLKDVEK